MKKAYKDANVDIKCNITSSINKEDLIITKLTATNFNDVNLGDKVIEKNAECNGSFLGFKFLLLFVFILF